MFAYCRTKPIRSVQYLGQQTRHARREDATSQPRIRGDAEAGTALSWSIDDGPQPDYAASFRAFKKAKEAGERKGAQLGLHMLVGVSPAWVREAGDLHDPDNPRNRQLLDAARAWADTWSNGGCYAARLDLDETGGAVVDLFIAPTSEQRHKSGKSKRVVSVNKALEAISLARTGKKSKHYSALNTDWAEYAREHLDARLERGRPKGETGAEHVGPDQYRTMMQEAQAARDAAAKAQAEAEAMKERAKEAEAKAAESVQKAEAAARMAAETAAAVITGGIVRDEAGKWTVTKAGPSMERLKPVWAILRPSLERVADWWQRVREKVEALPEPEQAKAELVEDPFLERASPKMRIVAAKPEEDSGVGLSM